MDSIILRKQNGYEEYPIAKSLTIGGTIFGRSGGKLLVKTEESYRIAAPYEWDRMGDGSEFFYLKENSRRYVRGERVTIAAHMASIELSDFPLQMLLEGNELTIVSDKLNDNTDCRIYLNQKEFHYAKCFIEFGDILFAGGYKITVLEKEILLNGNDEKITASLLEMDQKKLPFEGFPYYKRSPRIIKRVDSKTIDINKPAPKAEMKKGSIVQVVLPPLAMLCVTVAMSILMGRGLYVLMSVAGTVMTTIFSVTKFISEKQECKESNEKREQVYETYLLGKRKEVYRAYEKEKEAYHYNYPALLELEEMIHAYSERIYERNSNDDDFLCVTMGATAEAAEFKVKVSYDELASERDELEKEANDIKNEFSLIYDKPVVVDLKKAHLGLVGEKDNIHEQLKLLVAQLTFFQSYHDLEIITIYDEKYEEDFHWMRWYPHCHIQAINVLGNINSERKRDQVMGSLHQIIKDRKLKRDESKKEGRFLPHILFIIDEPKMIMDHSIMEYLDKEGDQLGFSIIYTTHLRANLPENIGTIVMLDNSVQGTLLLREREAVNKPIRLKHVEDVDLEWMARDLGVLVHMQGIISHIPESITFFEMYQVESPGELKIKERWNKNNSHKSLAVPLGVRAKEDYVYLNLHEKAHGPHGLVAGTTGSGKSEIVQSYILSLAVNFHPYEVGFLLIDYKGGGMAGLFKNLPHLLGTITNLDGSESMRAMASIKSELARRQRMFNEYDVNHINGYNKLFKSGKANEPMPHLFLISDEFAELKKEQPEFMTELVSAARIGRSLGIHLILATQKPTGVVDDQIWTNSKFKLALKVQNESDSKEILKTPDAANITQPGRAYLQVGNNEIYELFQSAWSGASYTEDSEEEVVDNRVYVVNDLGQGELVNQDLSGKEEGNQIAATQLDVVVNYVKGVFEEEGAEAVKRPWLPSLAQQIVSPHINAGNIGDVSQYQELYLEFVLGMVDIPEQQLQMEYKLNPVEDGNLAIFGASGYGKSVLLTTILLSLAVKNSPERLKYYILDLGNAALISLKNLPHTADYMGIDDSDKLNKFIRIIEAEIKTRKQLFASTSSIHFDMYNRIAEKKLPAILWIIDNYDVLRDMDGEMENYINQVSRDGTSLGIYLIIAASRPGVVKFTLMNNFKNKVALYMFDKVDISTVAGKTEYPLTEIRGRGLVKLENTNQIQIYTAVSYEKTIDYIDNIRAMVQEINDKYTGKKLEGIPMLPENLTNSVLREFIPDGIVESLVPIGLDTEEVKPQYIDLSKGRQIIVGGTQSGKTNFMKVMLENCPLSQKIYIVDSKESELYNYQNRENVIYINEINGMIEFLSTMQEIVEERRGGYEEAAQENPQLLPKQYYAGMEMILVLVEDWDNFIAMMGASKNLNAEKIMMELNMVNVVIITSTAASKMKGFDNLSKFMRETIYGVILGNPADQNIFGGSYRRQEKMEAGSGFLYQKGELLRIKAAKAE